MFNLQAYFDNLSTSELKTIKVGTGTWRLLVIGINIIRLRTAIWVGSVV